jgi:hypothetical protein
MTKSFCGPREEQEIITVQITFAAWNNKKKKLCGIEKQLKDTKLNAKYILKLTIASEDQ